MRSSAAAGFKWSSVAQICLLQPSQPIKHGSIMSRCHQHQWGVDTASMHHSRPLSSAPRLPQKCAASFFRPGLQSHFPSLQQRQRQQQQEHRFAARKSCFNFRTEHCKPCSQRCFTVLAASKTPEGEVSGKEGLANNGCGEDEEQEFRIPPEVEGYIPEGARPIPRQLGVLVTTWRSRALSFARESTLLIYSALIDNTLVVALERLQLDKLLRKAQPWLESGSAKLFGSYHEMADGTKIPLSLVNSTAPDFRLPSSYKLSELPFTLEEPGYDSQIAHFLSLCMKVVYEEDVVIQDISERLWGMEYHGYFSTRTPAASLYDVENKNTADFIPRTRACMLSTPQALIIAFRGSEPLNLINLRSSGKITMRPRFGTGRVHDGFYAALFHSDAESGSLYAQIIECLTQVDSTKNRPIFLSGHSLGGALAQVFAASLAANHPELADRVQGIYTYGMPRVGDTAFSIAMEKRYPACAFRITHAADIIPLVPPKFLEYHHFGKEHYLTSLGRHVQGLEDISKARRVETFGFLPLYLWKIVAGLAINPKEGSLRTVYRILMLFLLPGLNDHFPADYEYKLEMDLKT